MVCNFFCVFSKKITYVFDMFPILFLHQRSKKIIDSSSVLGKSTKPKAFSFWVNRSQSPLCCASRNPNSYKCPYRGIYLRLCDEAFFGEKCEIFQFDDPRGTCRVVSSNIAGPADKVGFFRRISANISSKLTSG